MKQFLSIHKIDSAILYGLELASSLSVVLLSVGVEELRARLSKKPELLAQVVEEM